MVTKSVAPQTDWAWHSAPGPDRSKADRLRVRCKQKGAQMQRTRCLKPASPKSLRKKDADKNRLDAHGSLSSSTTRMKNYCAPRRSKNRHFTRKPRVRASWQERKQRFLRAIAVG